MATTSNFGWTTPDDTDLVKDGALAIRTLGNNIDSSLVDLKGGTTGQILSKASNTDLDYTWINNDQGDITEVQAGTGISVASGTGPVPVVTNTVATTFDAKGDLVVGTGADTFAKLTTGSNGETLVADSTTTTGLRWQADWNVGKNKIINGDFFINQRGFSSAVNTGGFKFDRWDVSAFNSGTITDSAQSFTPGTAPVAGYEAANFYRVVTATGAGAGNYYFLRQKIESVRTLAGQTATISFWAKAGSGTPKIAIELTQAFGSGGSPSADVNTYVGQVTLSTSWTRYSATVSVPSISGKTIGTTANTSSLQLNLWVTAGSNYNSRTGSLGIQDATFDIWGVQVEAGSVATPFTTATGTLAGELAACQRYYFRTTTATDAFGMLTNMGPASSTTLAKTLLVFPVEMRVVPSSVEYSTILVDDLYSGGAAATAIVLANRTTKITMVEATVASGLTLGRQYALRGNNSTSAYLGLSAEL